MTAPFSNSILNVSNLVIGYGKGRRANAIASDINFELKKGTLTGLVGANGVGKSTLLRTLSGMQPGISGSVLLNSRRLSDIASLELATHLSVVLTEPPASKNLTVQELVSLGRQPYTNSFGVLSHTDKQIIRYAIEVTEIQNLINRKCFELSDGQLQRVVIARALAQDTELIILDEPTTHLDLYHRAYVLKLLKRLAADVGKTILFSTHEVDLAIQLSDYVLVMKKDRTMIGTPEALIADGSFQSLFPGDSINFDPESGRFTIKN